MSSFREIFAANIKPKNNDYSLNQGKGYKKKIEGFEGIPNDLKESDSMYNMWGTDATQTSNVGDKLKALNTYERVSYGPNGRDLNKFKEWGYRAATFSIHKDKMDKALVDCRKRCNENVGSGDKFEKQIEGCIIGCTVAYPRYSNPTSTFIPATNDGDNWKSTDSLELKLNKGNEICRSLAAGDSPVCKNGIVIAEKSEKLDVSGELGSGSPRTNCVECGGVNAIMGKWSYRYDNLTKDGRAIPNGGLITDRNKILSSGVTTYNTASATGLGCDNINDATVKNACKCVAGEQGAKDCGDINNVKFDIDENGNKVKTNFISSEFSDDLNKFGSRIGVSSSSWRSNDTSEKTLAQRYKEMTTAARSYQEMGKQTAMQFDKINDFIKLGTSDIKVVDSNLDQNLNNLSNYLGDVEKQKEKKDTMDGRYEDLQLKNLSQLYKNWAGGILAISLFTVAVYKLKQI